ncbi:MAG: hypothetical protein AAF281_12440 [Pseudomonadota bacterium]
MTAVRVLLAVLPFLFLALPSASATEGLCRPDRNGHYSPDCMRIAQDLAFARGVAKMCERVGGAYTFLDNTPDCDVGRRTLPPIRAAAEAINPAE